MKNKPKNLTNKQLALVKDTYRLILSDDVITDEEMDYLKRLYWAVFDINTDDEQTIIKDLAELAGWTIKDVSK